ncbi:MAG: type II toxin-antitoxin system HicA family toxin [Pseudomonadota bacterium]
MELTTLLYSAGWRRAENAKGSHEKWRHPQVAHSVIVPRSKSRHTANGVLKQAGLPKAF